MSCGPCGEQGMAAASWVCLGHRHTKECHSRHTATLGRQACQAACLMS